MSADGAERATVEHDQVPLPCTKNNSCFYKPNEMFVGGSRQHTCEHGDSFVIEAEMPRAVVYTTRNITKKDNNE